MSVEAQPDRDGDGVVDIPGIKRGRGKCRESVPGNGNSVRGFLRAPGIIDWERIIIGVEE